MYDGETVMISLYVESGDPGGREAQELLSEGLVDMSILKGGDIGVGEKEVGKDYDSDNSDISRGSRDTRMYQNRIYGFKGAVIRGHSPIEKPVYFLFRKKNGFDFPR